MNFEALAHIAREETRCTLDSLPTAIRAAVRSVPVFFERLPADPELDPDLLGLFDPGPADACTARITLWLDNLWDFADHNEPAFREEVRITLLHEIGHLVGWDEDDLQARGLD